MIKYQIRFCDSKGCGFFAYLDVKSKEGAEDKAAAKATEINIERRKKHEEESQWSPFKAVTRYQPKRVVHVWEWDAEKKKPKTKGHRFKLELYYFVATHLNGTKTRKEWYEPVTEAKTK